MLHRRANQNGSAFAVSKVRQGDRAEVPPVAMIDLWDELEENPRFTHAPSLA